jgi:hypothetical protein
MKCSWLRKKRKLMVKDRMVLREGRINRLAISILMIFLLKERKR